MAEGHGLDREAEYKKCQQRGHQPSDYVLSTMPPWEVCKWCGTAYRYEMVLHEKPMHPNAIVMKRDGHK